MRRVLVAAVASAMIAGCSGGNPATTSTVPSVVEIPDGPMAAFNRCMLDSGFRIAEVHEGYPGDPPWYTWESDDSRTAGAAGMAECQRLVPPARAKTDEELTTIYDRWVDERACMVRLGYSPDPPPSVEKFISDWRTVGPWAPIDGVDTTVWTEAQFREAKAECTLEMYDQ